MGKYANHEEFGVNAPINYREDTTSESYLKGMAVIAPPGMRPKEMRGHKFEKRPTSGPRPQGTVTSISLCSMGRMLLRRAPSPSS